MYQNAVPHINPLSIKLDRNNFHFWSTQVLSTARAHGLEGFPLGTLTCPSQSQSLVNKNGETSQVPNPEYYLWLRHDQFLMSWIFASIFEGTLGHVNRCLTAMTV